MILVNSRFIHTGKYYSTYVSNNSHAGHTLGLKFRIFFFFFFEKIKRTIFLTWKIKLIYTLLIHCKSMCCSQHFKTYLLSLRNIIIFDRRHESYVILLIYMLDWNSLVCTSPLNNISRLTFWKTERLSCKHIPIDFIYENAILLQIHVIVTL